MKDYLGFRFGNIHSEDLHLVVVSVSDRYDKDVLPNIKNYSKEVPGGNGSYYFGSTFGNKEIRVSVAFDNVKEETWRRISDLFASDKLQDLVFDELPYKTYKAKIKSKPEFKCLCFTDRDTEERIYKGEGTLQFICYQPFAYGFNKYIIRAADEYSLEIPKLPNYEDRFENPYEKEEKKIYNDDTKEFYNVEKNMKTPWKGGYPTIEQVRAGELYFTDEKGNKKIIDVRDYFRNVPEWAASSKLLVTPTLDYDQDLIFLPQYSKTNYINMDTGLNNENAMIGSRILVYNPGDVPVDFKMKLENVDRAFHTSRGRHFQIRRFNVERLPIAAAVDWTGLKTQNPEEDIPYKYGNKYFKIAMAKDGEEDLKEVEYLDLNDKHPSHAFIVEPIPKEKLGHYIRLFYWQSSLLSDNIDFEDGARLADRYEELYELCISDYERYELYWKTLKETILKLYSNNSLFENGESFDEFVYNYIHNPPEFIQKNLSLSYDQNDFNINVMPNWYTEDFLSIKTNNIENTTLFLDFEKRMLYNKIKPEYNINDKNTYTNKFCYKTSKKILNENIEEGSWFKIPTGWSLIEIAPVCDENIWGGKRWLDARPFDWGYKDNKDIQDIFNKVYAVAEKEFLSRTGLDSVNFRINNFSDEHELDSKDISKDRFAYEYYKTKEIRLEYEFLKLIHEKWRLQKGLHVINDKEVEIKGTIDEWWWYACNYIWALFPPLYWGYADILNKATIEYIPLYY